MNQTTIQLIEFFRLGINFHLDARCRLINQVNRLIRKETIGNVAGGKFSSSHNRRVGNFNTVVDFILFLQTAQNSNRVFDTRFVDDHFLETALQGGIFFNVLSVLVQGRGTDHMQFTAGKCRFEHVAGIHCTFCLTGTDHCMDFVDKQNDAAFFGNHFLQQCFQTFFEFAAVFRTGDKSGHIEAQDAFVAQCVGHFTVHNTLCQAFDHSGLTNTGFADKNRIVLASALQNLHRTANLVVSPDHRVELSFFGLFGQVNRVLLQRFTIVLSFGIVHFFTSAHG